MLIHIKAVLDQSRLQEVQSLLANAEFVDGKLSAGKEAGLVKHNEELSPNSPLRQRLDANVMAALIQNPEYQSAVLPRKVATAFYARYQPGMAYGFHVDDPVMGPMQGRYRSDVSTTVFLNDAGDYEGGDLIIRTPFGEQRIRGGAGDAIVYPSGSMHRVEAVRSGVRLVAVTWAQSMVKSAEQRELLYQLAQAREGLLQSQPQSEETAGVSTVYSNLVRMWSEV